MAVLVRRAVGPVALLVATASLAVVAGSGASATTQSATPSKAESAMYGITRAGSGYIAIGNAHDGERDAPVVWKLDKTGGITGQGTMDTPSKETALNAVTTTANGTVIIAGYTGDRPTKPGCCPYDAQFWRTNASGTRFNAKGDDTDWSTEQWGGVTTVDGMSAMGIASSDTGVVIAVGSANFHDGCACEGRPVVWTSTDDGRNWKADYFTMEDAAICDCTGPDSFRGQARGVAWSPDFGFVAVGTQWRVTDSKQNIAVDPTIVIWVSDDDGETWEEKTVSAAGYVAAGVGMNSAGIGVAGNSEDTKCDGTMWFSDDEGQSWSNTDPDKDLQLNDVGLAADDTIAYVGRTCGTDPDSVAARAYYTDQGERWNPIGFKPLTGKHGASMNAVSPYGKNGAIIVGSRNHKYKYWTGR